MANLDKCVSLFLTWVQHLLYGMDLLGRFRGNIFFYWFQGLNLLVDGQKFKMWGDIERERIKYFLFFINQNLCHILFLIFQFLQILH